MTYSKLISQDNGDIYDKKTRHLVSSARFVFNYAVATHLFNRSGKKMQSHLKMAECHWNCIILCYIILYYYISYYCIILCIISMLCIYSLIISS